MANVLISAPKTAKKGATIEIKALVLHPMETGFRPGTNGRIIPRNIIEHFSATWNGAEIFKMTMSPAIAANPFVSFFVVAKQSGPIKFRWTGDRGLDLEEQVMVAVT
jgi:sulfur-oxidizing protein SoxZ